MLAATPLGNAPAGGTPLVGQAVGMDDALQAQQTSARIADVNGRLEAIADWGPAEDWSDWADAEG